MEMSYDKVKEDALPAEMPAAENFDGLGLSPEVLQALSEEGYTQPTPIQVRAIPEVMAGRDLFGCAQTGTGKTAAFALPLIERHLHNRKTRQPRGCRVLVLAPTRELAAQIHDSFKVYGRFAQLKSAVVYGGVGQSPQVTALRHGVDVLIATPGRLLDLYQQRHLDLKHVDTLVLDEADRMLDMGFIHDVRRIVSYVPKERQTLFFSATLPDEVRDLASSMLKNPVEVKTTRRSTPAETVDQAVYHVPQKQKRQLLLHLLDREAMTRVIVFARTKHGADKLMKDLVKNGVRAEAIHGNKSQSQRERALREFKSKNPPVLIATDIAARGIDVDEVSHVVVYDLPHEPETYVHRIGRTGRAGLSGKAVAFCDHEERPRLRAIEKLLRKPIPVRTDVPQFAAVETGGSSERGESSGRSGGSGRSEGRGRRSGGGERSVIGGERGGPRFGKKRRKGSTEPRAVFEARSGREASKHGEARSSQESRRSGKPDGRPSGQSDGNTRGSAAATAPAASSAQKPGKRHRRAL
jgi:ATP-dependent RNA helicase RhlE